MLHLTLNLSNLKKLMYKFQYFRILYSYYKKYKNKNNFLRKATLKCSPKPISSCILKNLKIRIYYIF